MQPLMNSLKRLIYKEKKPLFSDFILSGRGSKVRTHDPRFWRPMLYQLSYSRVCGCKGSNNSVNSKCLINIFCLYSFKEALIH